MTAPSDQRRLEAGIFNYGNDMDITDNPYEVKGLERLVELDNENEVVSRAALEGIRSEGVSRKLVGVTIDGPPLGMWLEDFWPVRIGGAVAPAHIGRSLPSPRRQPRLRMGAHRTRVRRYQDGDRLPGGNDDGNGHADPVLDPKKEIPANS